MISLLMQYLGFRTERNAMDELTRKAMSSALSRRARRATFCWISLLGCFLVTSCVSNQTANQANNSQPNVLLVNTNSAIERYQIVQTAFENTLRGQRVTALDLQDDKDPVGTLQDQLNHHQYSAIYAIGAKALGSLDYIGPDAPIVYSSVLNWRRFKAHQNVYGVASDLAPQAQLTWLKHFFPDIARVGVIFGPDNAGLINEASKIANQLGIALVAIKAFNTTSVLEQADSLVSNVDVLWLISDPKVLSSTDTAKKLFQLADQHKTPVFAYSDIFADYGAVLTVSSDMATTGRQAALMVQQLLQNKKIGQEIRFPAGSNITLNLDKVSAYKLRLNSEALESVSHIIRSK